MKKLCVWMGVVALFASGATAQVTLANSATNPASPVATTTGNFHSVDPTSQIGAGSILRAAGASSASYLSTGAALDVTTPGFATCTANNGCTIQFWLRPGTTTGTFLYHWGDANWVGTNGAFRCFQNGAAGVGNLIVRGPLTQVATVGTPLTTAQNTNGWIHFAVVIDNTAGSITWYVNGAVNNTGASTPLPATATKGTNLSIFGYEGSAAAGHSDRYDDFRVYDWARSAADIAADYQSAAIGSGPSGCNNIPDAAYFDCESSLNAHNGTVALLNEPLGSGVRLFTAGDTLTWAASSPASGPYPATALINATIAVGPGNPRVDAHQASPPLPGGPYRTSVVPTLSIGHCLSLPGRSSIAFPDGLGVGIATSSCPGGGAIPVPYTYGAGQTPPSPLFTFALPAGIPWIDGDRIDIEWVTQDPGYPPIGIASTNRTTFMYVNPTRQGPAVHVEARGVDVIQVTGFFEVHNTGTVPITKFELDLGPVAKTWDPMGALNSGGTLATGDSYRYNTDAICDLTPASPPTSRYTVTGTTLAFNFTAPPAPADGFQGPTNHFVFDCDTSVTGSGATFIGAIAKVTFADNTVLSGPLIADPNDPQAAIIDL